MMGTMARTPLRAMMVLAATLLWGVSHAQDSESYEPDPPERAARLSYLSGDVSLQPVGEEDWAPAILNRPLTTGDKLWTDQGARAEIHVGPAAVRLDGATGFSFLNVDDDTIQMRMTAGVINVSVRRLEGSEHIEIDTPNIALSLLRAGTYRVEVNDAGDATVVKVSEGAAQATGPSQDIVVHAQQAVTFTGTENLVAQHGSIGAPDEFDSWSLERDRNDERASSSRTAEYVSPDVTGYQDLEDNGTWSSEPEYGYVWTPRYVAVDWAPYRYGRWVWVAPWGYTWIDDARWGYAPFHYGRWAHVRNRWCWVPGPRHARAVYAPALVGWVGSPGARLSWFPLGPREVYVPRRGYSRRYLERVNHSNTVISNRNQITEAYANSARNIAYRNRSVPDGVTAASRATFTSGGRIGNHRVRLSEPELARSPATALAPRIEPGRESRMGGPPRSNVRVPPRSVVDRQVVVRREPPQAAARFARQPPVVRDVERAAGERSGRPQVRVPESRESIDRAALRDRADRPPRAERPGNESVPPAQSSVFDRRALSERVRADRDRQVRDVQRQRDVEQQREAAARQRWQSPAAQTRQIREQSQAPREQPRQDRERAQRQPDAVRQSGPRMEPRERAAQRERSAERPPVQQPRVQQPRAEQPRVERPRAEQPRPERPQVERPSRSEPAQRPAESGSRSDRRSENRSR
jgi:hypothetical protein